MVKGMHKWLALVTVLASARVAAADDEVGIYLGVHGFSAATTLGRVVLTDPLNGEVLSTNSTPDTGIPLGFRYGHRFDPRWSFELELEGMAVSTRDELRSGAVLGYRGHVAYQLTDASTRFQPFVIAGVGAHTAILGYASETDVDSAFYGTVGGGLQLAFNRAWALRLDVRTFVGPGGGDASVSADVEALIGFCYSGGGACGWQPAGLVEHARSSPPQRDSDGDGIVGDADRCPITPEDRDGVDDDDGCPDLDDDGDGLPEPGDRCPKEAENQNGFEDDDGCPDTLPEAVAEFDGVVAGLRFRADSPALDRASFDTLDRLAAGLAQYPELHVRIVVHTAEQQLADQRAGAIRQYLIDRGVEGGRVQVLGQKDEHDAHVEIHFVPPG
jgi:OmpA-OmpF porin, OOP family